MAVRLPKEVDLHEPVADVDLMAVDLKRIIILTPAGKVCTEVLFFIQQQQLMGKGIGYIDAHLLTSVALAPPTRLWTRDRSLQDVASSLELDYKPLAS